MTDDPIDRAFRRLRADAASLSTDAARRRSEATDRRSRLVPAGVGLVAVALVIAIGAALLRSNDEPDVLAADPDAIGDTDGAVVHPDVADVDGTSWILERGTGPEGPIVPDPEWPVTLAFGLDGSAAPMPVVSGVAACNGYGGPFQLADGRFALGDGFGRNDAGCDTAVVAVESAFLAALFAVDRVELAGDSLVFRGDDAELVFRADTIAPVDDVVGRTWLLHTLVEGGAETSAGGSAATLKLHLDGSVSGGTGCRLLSGEWVRSGASIHFPSFAAAGECAPELSDQDGLVVEVLGDGFDAEVDGDQLILTSAGGVGLIYGLAEDAVESSVVPPGDLAEVLADTRWLLAEGTIPTGEIGFAMSLNVDAGGSAAGGQAGCDLYGLDLTRPLARSGPAAVADVDGTAAPCRTAAWSPAPDDVFFALGTIDEVVVDGDELLLIGPGTELRFVPAGSEAMTVDEFLDGRPAEWVRVEGYVGDRGGGPFLCSAPIDSDDFCRGRFVPMVGDDLAPGDDPVRVVGTYETAGRLLVDSAAIPGWPGPEERSFVPTSATSADDDLVEALMASRLDDPALRWHPAGVMISLGGDQRVRTLTPTEVLDPVRWGFDVVEGFRGRVGPFSALDVLAGGATPDVTFGTHAHCASPPEPLPAVAFDRQIVIQPTGIDSCLQWYVVDILIDASGSVVAVNLDLWEP